MQAPSFAHPRPPQASRAQGATREAAGRAAGASLGTFPGRPHRRRVCYKCPHFMVRE